MLTTGLGRLMTESKKADSHLPKREKSKLFKTNNHSNHNDKIVIIIMQ